ncbi:hypothetical protein MBCUT_15990 [Methanobrevibacter cuticularis]|uniref:Uncharacterized protein n=1 Tax=Methanobrevibacter cuticularis TaxID=47311 RepID=A0A166D774_9EURY|nr:hypothetical protein [Methanobrevibacter cuticularis]KZX15274.1 hypothetical protein MBCUT_15990 [Methanobrevibacter cuticularis]
MTDEKISEIYSETITAIRELRMDSSDEEKEELYKIINKNKNYLGFDNFEAEMISYWKIKDLELEIHKNIRMASQGSNSISLKDLQEKLEEEPTFIEQFNF